MAHHQYLRMLHSGDYADFEAFVRDFRDAAGADLVAIAEGLVAETSSPHAKCLIAAMLGHARDPASLPLLKKLLAEGASTEVSSTALYSIGRLGTSDAGEFLVDLWRSLGERSTPGNLDRQPEDLRDVTAAALGLCGKVGVDLLYEAAAAHLKLAGVQAASYFGNSELALVSSAEAFDRLKAIAEEDADPRLRMMAIAAIAKSPSLEQRKYLALLYGSTQDPAIRKAIVRELLSQRNCGQTAWMTAPEHAETFDYIVSRSKVPSGDRELDGSLLLAAGRSRTPEAMRFVDQMLETLPEAFGTTPQESRSYIGAAFGLSGPTPDRIETWLRTRGLAARERAEALMAVHWSGGLPLTHPPFVEDLLAYASQAGPVDFRVTNAGHLLLLRSSDVTEAQISDALARRFAVTPDPAERTKILDAIARSADISECRMPRTFLLSVIVGDEMQSRIQAARLYLRSGDAASSTPPSALAAVAGRAAVDAMDTTAIAKTWQGRAALCELIGGYYARYGQPSDVAWLGQLAQTLPGLPPEDRTALREQCTRAIDAIHLRSK